VKEKKSSYSRGFVTQLSNDVILVVIVMSSRQIKDIPLIECLELHTSSEIVMEVFLQASMRS
jgi:hypothetical protein